MKTIIMKFGGSSLAEPEKIKLMAERAAFSRRRGLAVVMVVSAPANVTDDLLALSELLTSRPDPRELDALLAAGEQFCAALTAMAIAEKGVRAVSLTGVQAGIMTDSRHTDSDIISIRPARVLRELKKGRIAVVAGFQGAAKTGDIATLGRGGSDLTAVALARALKADICELYTDVKGIYTANPTVVPQAKKIPYISYDAVIQLARSGTEVRQFRAIAYAKKYSIPLHLRSSFENEEGTRVGNPGRVGPDPVVICFSIRGSGKSAELNLIGSKLDAAEIKKALRETASVSGCVLKKEIYAPDKITLVTSFQDGEPLLKALHKAFI
ncbi:MAG: aspartate kinase [Syntrophales bacterium]|jgi:aspartate kinase|nr:aspartate kinase [Syntrophales bacterium]